MELKKPITIEEQLEKIKSHGMIVEDDEVAKRILVETNYYRLTGYVLQYRKSPNNSDYVQGLTFNKMCQIYCFDEALRDVLRKYIEKVEIYYRSLISHYFSLAKCKEPPHDQHYDENNFFYKQGYAEVMESFTKERSHHYQDSLIVKHHKKKYGDQMPLWVMVELLSFSNVSKLYKSMYFSEQQQIADVVGVGIYKLENHLHCLSVLRNKCAHAARLYHTTFKPSAQFTPNFLRRHPNFRPDTLFAYILVLFKHLPDEAMKTQLANDVFIVLDEYCDVVDLSLIGFPENYKDYFV